MSDMDADMRAAVNRRLAELHERRAYGLQQRHATKLARTDQEDDG